MACFELVPSPKSQYQETGASSLLAAANNTVKGAVPEVTLAEKYATGIFGIGFCYRIIACFICNC